MRLKTYTAADMPAALRLIRDELGQNALILNTRKVKNARGEPTLEITAAINEPELPTTEVPPPPVADKKLPAYMQGAKVMSSAQANHAELDSVLRAHKLPAELVARLTAAVQGLTAAQFSPTDALEMVLAKTLPLKGLADLLPTSHAHVFVGPHGAGKTSLIIRLAQQWKNSGAQIVMFSLDNLKLGGFEPLEQAAEIFDIPARLITDFKDLSNLGRQLGPSLRILIDTPGLAPADRVGQQKLRAQLMALNLPLAVHLLLPAAFHGEQLPLLPAAYQTLHPASLIASRLDEALAIGPLVATLAGAGLHSGLATNSPQLTVPVQNLSPRWLAEILSTLPRQPWELGQ